MCTGQDEYGNATGANVRLDVVPPDSVTVEGVVGISATKVGGYEVTCYSSAVEAGQRGKATLTVVPGPQVGLTLHFTPEALAYNKLQTVTVVGRGVDVHGNMLADDIAIENVTVAPDGHHRILGDALNQLRIDLEGIYQVSANQQGNASVTATGELVVDETRPLLVLTSPERGVVTDSLSEVTVAGTVSDNLGRIGTLRVGDRPIPFPPEGGAFSIQVPLSYALNMLDVHAADPYGNTALATRAVQKSTEFHAMVAPTFETDAVDNALALVLMPEIFDDGDDTELVRDDLAHIMEFIVRSLDIASLLPNPLTEFDCINGKCRLEFDSVTTDDVIVNITLTPGRLHMRVELVKLVGNVTLYFPCDVAVICSQRPVQPLPGKVETQRVVVDSDIFLAIIDGETVAQTENTVMQMEGLEVKIEDPTGIGQAAIELLIGFLQEPLVQAIENLIVGLIQNELADALDGLFQALNINEEFVVSSPVPGQEPNTVIIRTKPKGVDIAPERMQVRVDGLSYAKFPKRPHEVLGSLGHRGCATPTALAFPPPTPLALGLHDDLVNQLVFAIWEGGTLSLDLGPEEAASLVGDFGLQDAHIKVDAFSPPVFNSCGADGDKVLERIQLGDVFLDAEAIFLGAPIRLTLWLMTEAPVDVEFAPNEAGALQIKLVIGALEPMWIEVVRNEGQFEGNDEAVIALVRDTLVPQLLSSLTESAVFTLPSIDLGSMTTAVPAGTIINFDVRDVGRDNQYLTVYGGLE